MLEKLSRNVSNYFIRMSILNNEDAEICTYGLQIILSSIISILLVLFVSICRRDIVPGCFYLASYCSTRAFSGGYHASSHFKCISLFVLSYILMANLQELCPVKCVPFILIIRVGITILFSPEASLNNSISNKSKKSMKKKAVINILILLFASLLFIIVREEKIAKFIALGAAMCDILVILNVLSKYKRRKYL